MSQNGNGHNGTYTAQQFIAVIQGSAGIVSTIASRVGCEWHTARRYIDNYATVRQAYEDERQHVIDLAETTVLKAIKDGDTGTARWYLSTIGKDRGYVERRETTGKDGGAIETKAKVTFDVRDFTDAELEALDSIAERMASGAEGAPEA